MAGSKLLLVDDSVSMRQVLAYVLKSAGFVVEMAKNGKEALTMLGPEIKLVITDYNMPEMNGIDFIRAIRSGLQNKSVPIIILTTETEESKRKEARDAGVTAWIQKPFNQDEILELINKLISGPVF